MFGSFLGFQFLKRHLDSQVWERDGQWEGNNSGRIAAVAALPRNGKKARHPPKSVNVRGRPLERYSVTLFESGCLTQTKRERMKLAELLHSLAGGFAA
jgi:hypothetical protein